MRRRSASPDAETMSQLPPPPLAIRLTISSDEPAGCWLTLQPVAAVNGSTHDLSAYPSHRTRFSWPSPAPIVVCGAVFAVGGCSAVEPLGVLDEPQAVSVSTAAAAKHPHLAHLPGPPSVKPIFSTSPSPRERTCGPRSRRA